METRFNEVSRDWANWFVISRVSCIKNLVITNLLENNQSVRYIGVELIINRSNKREREKIKQIRFYDSARVILYMCAVVTEKLLSYFKVKEFSSLLVCFALIFCRVMTFIRYIGVDFTFGFLDCVRYIEDFLISRFVMSRFCSINFTVTLAGLKNIVRYTVDVVI